MRHLTRLLCSTAVAIAVTAACGGFSATPSAKPSATPTTGGRPTPFPVTITRAGGVAGFRDGLVVSVDGLVSITRKGQKPRRCRLTAGALNRLKTAASALPRSRIKPANTNPVVADELVTTVRSPAGGPIRLEGPGATKQAQVFLDLLNELFTGDRASSRTCRPG